MDDDPPKKGQHKKLNTSKGPMKNPYESSKKREHEDETEMKIDKATTYVYEHNVTAKPSPTNAFQAFPVAHKIKTGAYRDGDVYARDENPDRTVHYWTHIVTKIVAGTNVRYIPTVQDYTKILKEANQDCMADKKLANRLKFVALKLAKSSPGIFKGCLLYTSPSPRDQRGSRMPSSA